MQIGDVNVLADRKVLLGVTGGIAAYKSVELVRLLRKSGAEVQVVMTGGASQFVTPMTLQAVSGRTVRQDLFDPGHEAAMGHIELARWADVVLVAPASASFIARLANGFADNLLSTLCLATAAPLILAPAMNQQMWQAQATQHNVGVLLHRGVRLWGPALGDQACGEVGPGRMVEPEALFQQLCNHFSSGPLSGVRVLLTAGPTREPIDPVRFIGNRSSGKMGFALARAFVSAGATVELVAGPVSLATPAGVARFDVETAREMEQKVLDRVTECDIFVGCAAVADYRPEVVADQKIKKNNEQMEIHLVRNNDILATVAALSKAPFTVGFAAETQAPETYAEKKRIAKKIDMIAANLVGASEGGFERDENALTLLWEGGQKRLPLADKGMLAEQLVTLITERYENRYPA
ncbi:bifunctional phosphopantothenoylcysteine decarboxylase/phosphopantothenate--cysteine ligase CoaBC [Sedimenticola selenatireducens]|uniref:Coenzyme A biosynthesis bifunctional protein CoaBC n=1 Tax=Sedimenticola selenatireducens TaxID=191960 RepID=A0A557SHZ2_9GAMM|nr:bifunctional phosphopantothenoylcysteine decarboxylase/phosphopantothenate--cysteine ligase CoaBC [Sedimenticola selenatireducens]TVO77048.1 bifunctional phosphopantothenoylcysteine decarboxylase/phosphopantothenate--cysteine ligase CoaBC [Sedimenticola selenatireducens]TVT64490.1 MAG: bifunctional phosphopantothenoylcysteine decarboxylase/phosphopantothenate--cysteine ligase CoaBC [Sedimenticola selenatireducens]